MKEENLMKNPASKTQCQILNLWGTLRREAPECSIHSNIEIDISVEKPAKVSQLWN